MKLVISLLMLMSAPAFATGGFDCGDKAAKNSIGAAVSHGLGSLISDVTVLKGGIERKFKRDQVIQYKNTNNELFAVIVDFDQSKPDFEEIITLDVKGERGKLSFESDGKKETFKVECILE